MKTLVIIAKSKNLLMWDPENTVISENVLILVLNDKKYQRSRRYNQDIIVNRAILIFTK